MTMTVEITLNGRDYLVACSEGEAPRIRELAKQLTARVNNLQSQLGTSASDAYLMVMVNLMLLDELSEAQLKVVAAQKSAQEAAAVAQKPAPEEEEILISAVLHLTDRVNNIAKKLQAA